MKIIFRFILGCVAFAAIFWALFILKKADPPIIDFDDVRVAEGVYFCDTSRDRRKAPHMVNGLIYYHGISPIFGVTGAASNCFNELIGKKVKVLYLQPKNYSKRLRLEWIEVDTNLRWGSSRSDMAALYSSQLKWPWSLYALKAVVVGLSTILLFTFVFNRPNTKTSWGAA